MTFAVVGGGVMGRFLALYLARKNLKVALFDERSQSGRGACSFVAGGMISPLCELDGAEPVISQLGMMALSEYENLGVSESFSFSKKGAVVVAHGRDLPELERFARRLKKGGANEHLVEGGEELLRELEPELLEKFSKALFLKEEGHLDPEKLLKSLHHQAVQEGVQCHFETHCTEMVGNRLTVKGETQRFEKIFDCRGLGARHDRFSSLRGVRGEIYLVEAPEVRLSRPVRVLHPRFPVYIAPRGGNRFVIGATSLESEDTSPVSVLSTLELLSAAYAAHAGFAEARILESRVSCRPAFPDNLPRIVQEDGVVRVNGLYRHGYLIAPALARLVTDFVDSQTIPEKFASIFSEKVVL